MVGEWIRFGFCAFFVLCGLSAVVAAVVGVYRFKDAMCKMHAAAMIDTLALLSFVLAAVIAFGFGVENVKMLLTVLFLWITSPVNSHLLARLEYMTGGSRGGKPVELPDEQLEDESAGAELGEYSERTKENGSAEILPADGRTTAAVSLQREEKKEAPDTEEASGDKGER